MFNRTELGAWLTTFNLLGLTTRNLLDRPAPAEMGVGCVLVRALSEGYAPSVQSDNRSFDDEIAFRLLI